MFCCDSDVRERICQASEASDVQDELLALNDRWQNGAVTRREKPVPPPGFAANLDVAMRRAGVGPSDLERRTAQLGKVVNNSTITRYRNGERARPQGEIVAVLAKALGVTVEALLGTGEGVDVVVTIPDEEPAAIEEPARLHAALEDYPWPEGVSTARVAEISTALRSEWFAHRGAFIPASHWRMRIGEELAAGKGKLVTPRTGEEVNTDEESPEVREHKARAKRAKGRNGRG
jgi:transcriptional regulator with XRE-family HTH domain